MPKYPTVKIYQRCPKCGVETEGEADNIPMFGLLRSAGPECAGCGRYLGQGTAASLSPGGPPLQEGRMPRGYF